MKRCSFALLLTLAAGASLAQSKTPIYRCGQTYSQTPCTDGHLIDSADPRTAAQRAEARRAADREKQLAAEMERDRRAAEGASAPVAPAAFTSTGVEVAKPAASAPANGKKKKDKAGKASQAASGAGVVFITPRPPQK